MKAIFIVALMFTSFLNAAEPKNSPTPAMKSAMISAFGNPGFRDQALGMGLQYVQLKLASTDIKALNTTPVLAVTSPGEGKALIPMAVYATMDYRTGTYATNSNESIDVEYGGSGSGDVAVSVPYTFLEATADKIALAPMVAVEPVENTALYAHISGGNPTAGDSDVYLRIYYKVVDSLLSE